MTATAEARAIELLVDRATEGLPPGGQSELSSLLQRFPRLDDDSFDLAAAAIDLAYTAADVALPRALCERVTARAAGYFAVASGEGAARAAEVLPFPAAGNGAETRRAGAGPWLGWLAAAACLALAVSSWLPRPQAPAPAPAQARADLIARASDLLQLEWTATEDPAGRGAGGDLVWSSAAQAGFMRFRSLPVNDPAVEQYQLWIFDAGQDERYPIDGGVFDVTAPGEAVVPIDPKLRVNRPTLFAVTVEKPGGVVVSSRQRLPLVAKVG